MNSTASHGRETPSFFTLRRPIANSQNPSDSLRRRTSRRDQNSLPPPASAAPALGRSRLSWPRHLAGRAELVKSGSKRARNPSLSRAQTAGLWREGGERGGVKGGSGVQGVAADTFQKDKHVFTRGSGPSPWDPVLSWGCGRRRPRFLRRSARGGHRAKLRCKVTGRC